MVVGCASRRSAERRWAVAGEETRAGRRARPGTCRGLRAVPRHIGSPHGFPPRSVPARAADGGGATRGTRARGRAGPGGAAVPGAEVRREERGVGGAVQPRQSPRVLPRMRTPVVQQSPRTDRFLSGHPDPVKGLHFK